MILLGITDFLPPDLLSQKNLVTVGLVGVIVWLMFPGVGKFAWERIKSLKGGANKLVNPDSRSSLHEAVDLLSDYVAGCACEKAKFRGDQAITILSSIVSRKQDYKPPVNPDQELASERAKS